MPNPGGKFLLSLLIAGVAWGLARLLGLSDPVSLFAVGLMGFVALLVAAGALLDVERLIRMRIARRRIGRRVSLLGRLVGFVQGRLITVAVIAVFVAPIWYLFDDELVETARDVGNSFRTREQIDLAETGDTLKKQLIRPLRPSVLGNPGKLIGLPDDVQAKLDAQIKVIAESGQEVLCCDYDTSELPRMCTGLVLWKDRMPMPLEDFVDVHQYSALAYLGIRAVPECPKTRKEAWDIVGRIPGYGWSPMNHGKPGHAPHLRALMP